MTLVTKDTDGKKKYDKPACAALSTGNNVTV